jgi:hypothetical protein
MVNFQINTMNATVYDSADEIEKEVQRVQTTQQRQQKPKGKRIVKIARRVQAGDTSRQGMDLSMAHQPAVTHGSQPAVTSLTTHGSQPAVTSLTTHGSQPAVTSLTTHGSPAAPAAPVGPVPPLGFDPEAFPTSMQWSDKLQILGAVFIVAEALGREGCPMEFTDRVAWVACMGLVGNETGEIKDKCKIYRRQLSELRATHLTFALAASHHLIHASILILMRTVNLISMVYEFVAEPFAWVIERNVQDLVFLCDFVSVVAPPIQVTTPLPLGTPAQYANETAMRLLPLKAMRNEPIAPNHLLVVIKTLTEQSNVVSNVWLRKNLARLATGLKIYSQSTDEDESRESKTVNAILKERADAIVNWGRVHGFSASSTFHDPLFAVEY